MFSSVTWGPDVLPGKIKLWSGERKDQRGTQAVRGRPGGGGRVPVGKGPTGGGAGEERAGRRARARWAGVGGEYL